MTWTLICSCQQRLRITVKEVQPRGSRSASPTETAARFLLLSCSPSPLSGPGWAVQWGWLNICSTRWTRGRPAGQSLCQTCASAASWRRRGRTASRSRSPVRLRGAAGGGRAPRASPCCCAAPPTSCCSETEPRMQSSCLPTRASAPTCTQCPRQTCRRGRKKESCW